MTEPNITEFAIDVFSDAYKTIKKSPIPSQPALAMLANAAATLALVSQQRLANLIALANSDHGALNEQVAADAAGALAVFRQHENPVVGGWYELAPEVADELGIDLNGEGDE